MKNSYSLQATCFVFLALLGCATPPQVTTRQPTRLATLEVAIGEMYGNKLVRIRTRDFRLKIDGSSVKPQPQWDESCVSRLGKLSVCDHGSKYIYGSAITKFDIKPGNHLVELCTTSGDCASQEINIIDEHHTEIVGFVYHLKEYEYRKVAQYQGISWHAKFEKNKYDSYVEPVLSEKGMKKLIVALEELQRNSEHKKPKKIQPGSGFDK